MDQASVRPQQPLPTAYNVCTASAYTPGLSLHALSCGVRHDTNTCLSGRVKCVTAHQRAFASQSCGAGKFLHYNIKDVLLLIKSTLRRHGGSNPDPLDLIERNFIAPPVVESCRPRRLMGCHLLRNFQPPPILEIGGDAGRPEGMAANLSFDSGYESPPANHAPDIGLE
jgi:hypothetical protein